MNNAVVQKSTGSWYILLTEDGKQLNARLKGKFKLEGKQKTNPIAVGDKVRYSMENGTQNAVIEEIIPRKNYIIRRASNLSRQEHIIASNLDQVLIMATLALPRTSQGFIDRVLATAEAYDIPAIIAFNKIDLYNQDGFAFLEDMMKMYEELGYKCFAISVKKQENLDVLREALEGKVTLLTGHSGVGKSSLLNYLHPVLDLKTSEVSAFSSKGKHTTTFAEMHPLNNKTFIIDTPGIKEFGLVEMDKYEIGHYFPEIREYMNECRFNNCLHVNEPGCAVIEAVEEGKIHPSRYNSYLSMLHEEDTHS